MLGSWSRCPALGEILLHVDWLVPTVSEGETRFTFFSPILFYFSFPRQQKTCPLAELF